MYWRLRVVSSLSNCVAASWSHPSSITAFLLSSALPYYYRYSCGGFMESCDQYTESSCPCSEFLEPDLTQEQPSISAPGKSVFLSTYLPHGDCDSTLFSIPKFQGGMVSLSRNRSVTGNIRDTYILFPASFHTCSMYVVDKIIRIL